MHRTLRRAVWTAAVFGVCVVVTTGATSDARHAPTSGTRSVTEPRIDGSGRIVWLPGDDVRFTFHARGFAFDARGRFSGHHRTPGSPPVWWRGRVDCLITGGNVATVTGIVTAGSRSSMVGTRMGWSVADEGTHDRVGFTPGGMFPDGTSVTRCTALPPYQPLRSGGYDVVDWFPPLVQSVPGSTKPVS